MFPRRILISVYHISGYLMAEVASLIDCGAEVAIIEYPCGFSRVAHQSFMTIKWIDMATVRNVKGVLESLNGWSPDTILCCGWDDKLARKVAKYFRRRGATTVVGVDNPWERSLRQIAHCIISRFYLTHIFDFGWGAGAPQTRYLRFLGFSKDRIKKGFYAADTEKFLSLTHENKGPWPHSFIYVGRYAAEKNMRRMERGFLKALKSMPESDWKLCCIGDGELWEERTIHPCIKHLGYKLPSELQDFVRESGCFVLASTNEHWGVVVHEFALMGLPLICSRRVMSVTDFLLEGENGFLFNPYDEDDIAEAFCAIMRMQDDALSRMGRKSRELGMRLTTNDWAERLLLMRTELLAHESC